MKGLLDIMHELPPSDPEPVEQPLDLEEARREIWQKINEVDQAGESGRTLPLKKELEEVLTEHGDVPPTRLRHLQKKTDEVYYQWLADQDLRTTVLERQSDQAEAEHSSEEELSPDQPVIIYFGTGCEGPGSITFRPRGHCRWETSAVGAGYTADASFRSDWISESIVCDKILYKDSGVVSVTTFTTTIFEGSVLGVPATIETYERDHENGVDERYRFTFPDAETEGLFLSQLRREKEQREDPQFVRFIVEAMHDHDKYVSLIHLYERYCGQPLTSLTPERRGVLAARFGLSPKDVTDARDEMYSRYFSRSESWPMRPDVIAEKLSHFWEDVAERLASKARKPAGD